MKSNERKLADKSLDFPTHSGSFQDTLLLYMPSLKISTMTKQVPVLIVEI